MTCEHVCYPCKVRTGADTQECKNMLRKHNAAYHQKYCAYKNTAVYDCLHNAERTVRALHKRGIPTPVQCDMSSPEHKQRNA